jgi:hypothetical protein
MRKISSLSLSFVLAVAVLSGARAAAPEYRITKTTRLAPPTDGTISPSTRPPTASLWPIQARVTLVDRDSGAVVGHLGPINHTNGVLIANGRVYATNQDPDMLRPPTVPPPTRPRMAASQPGSKSCRAASRCCSSIRPNEKRPRMMLRGRLLSAIRD